MKFFTKGKCKKLLRASLAEYEQAMDSIEEQQRQNDVLEIISFFEGYLNRVKGQRETATNELINKIPQ